MARTTTVTAPSVKAPGKKAPLPAAQQTRQQKPSAPAKPVAPAKPGKPAVDAPVISRREMTFQTATPVKAPKAAKPEAPARDDSETKALIADMRSQIEQLNKLVAKKAAKERPQRTKEEILEGAKLPNDWRAEYQGHELTIFYARFDKQDNMIVDRENTIGPVLLALPRDTDLGGEGSKARNSGRLAVHWERSEDGSFFFGAPLYVTSDELADIWKE